MLGSTRIYYEVLFLNELYEKEVPDGKLLRTYGYFINSKDNSIKLTHHDKEINIDTNLINVPLNLHDGKLYMVFGSLYRNNNDLFCRATIIKDVSELDLELFEKSIILRRSYLSKQHCK